MNLPVWIRERKLDLGALHEVRTVMSRGGLHTVCDEARCPNRSECFSRGTALLDRLWVFDEFSTVYEFKAFRDFARAFHRESRLLASSDQFCDRAAVDFV